MLSGFGVYGHCHLCMVVLWIEDYHDIRLLISFGATTTRLCGCASSFIRSYVLVYWIMNDGLFGLVSV